MPSTKVNKIDISSPYPCPCRRHGHLSPIILTEALGCEQCHRVFVVKPDGYTIEQCSDYPHQSWYWTGRRWQPSRKRQPLFYLRLLLFWLLVMGIIVLVLFPTLLPLSFKREFRFGLAVFMAVPTLHLGSYLYRR